MIVCVCWLWKPLTQPPFNQCTVDTIPTQEQSRRNQIIFIVHLLVTHRTANLSAIRVIKGKKSQEKLYDLRCMLHNNENHCYKSENFTFSQPQIGFLKEALKNSQNSSVYPFSCCEWRCKLLERRLTTTLCNPCSSCALRVAASGDLQALALKEDSSWFLAAARERSPSSLRTQTKDIMQ